MYVPAESAFHQSNLKETADKHKMRNILLKRREGPVFFKNVNIIKDKKVEEMFQIKGS